MLKTFRIPYYNDNRMTYVREYLEKYDYQYTECNNSDFTVLPIKPKRDMINNSSGIIFYGYGDCDGYDYGKEPSFELKNAIITAEGAISLYNENSNEALYGKKALITGYGRIAKALHKLLKAYACSITVSSRSEISKTQAIYNGANHITLDKLKNKSDYDIIFNTIPHCIFNKNELDALSYNALLIDLASFPGGVDTLYAKSKGIRLIDGTKLPSRFYPRTAGYLIGEAIRKIIEEERL